jgi:hypothetical protein
MPYNSGYDDEVKSAEKLIKLVGEDTVARAYFKGEMSALHQAFNNRFGPCALITWAFHLQAGSNMQAEAVLENRNQDYCQMTWGKSKTAGSELTPPPPAQSQTQQQEQSKTEQSR